MHGQIHDLTLRQRTYTREQEKTRNIQNKDNLNRIVRKTDKFEIVGLKFQKSRKLKFLE